MANKELLETIRKEIINRIDKRHLSEQAKKELVSILAKLSDLEKEEKPIEGLEEELVKYIGYPEENLDGKWKKKEVEEIARHFYELGRQSKPTTAEGLEDEFIRYIHEKDAEVSERGESTYAQEDLEDIARHFAKWGAEHRGCLEIPNDLEEAAEISFDEARALTEDYLNFLAKGLKENHPRPIGPHWFCKYAKNRFIAGAKWQKEQMMREAVEAKIYGYDDGSFELIASWLDIPNNSIYKDGDKVKIIIVKEEGK